MTALVHKGRTVALLLLLAAHLGYAAFLAPRGHFTVDEGVYHMMARALAENGSVAVWNGYAETPSEELIYTFLLVDDRDAANPRLVPQYPVTYALIAAPAYLAAGLDGLFYINLLAFLVAVAFTFDIARRLFGDSGLALNAALILVIGTFTWEYVHAIWPHMLAMAFAAGAMLAGIVAIQQEDRRRTMIYAALAGLATGIGAGVRYDTILIAPALILPFMFSSPPRIAPVLSLLAGLVPGLLILSLGNDAKFGTLSPFSYGLATSGNAAVATSYIGVVAVAVTCMVLLWVATRPRIAATLAQRRWWLAAVAIALVAVVLAVPPLRALALRLADGTWQLVVDLRLRSLDIVEWGVSRTPGGAVAYDQALKKSLLQSCPWLVVLMLPLAQWLRRGRDRAAVAPLFLAIGAFIAFYGYSAWHGGFSYNMRYFVSVLPFAAVLGAHGWKGLADELPPRWRRAAMVAGFPSIVVWVAMLLQDPGLGIEPLLLNPPLVLAAALVLVLLLRAGTVGRVRMFAAAGAIALTAMSLAWATAAALLYDLPRSYNTRADSRDIAAAVSPELIPDSILFSRYANTVSNLISAGRIRLAFPRNDDFADFRRLLELHLSAGRPAYIAFNDDYLATAADRRLLEGLRLEPLYTDDGTHVARVVREGER